jgi:ATP-dependent DNA helicase 2 subunit 1
MHTPGPDRHNPDGVVRGKSALHQVLDFVAKFEKSKVITGPADSVGVMLWNVDVGLTQDPLTSAEPRI